MRRIAIAALAASGCAFGCALAVAAAALPVGSDIRVCASGLGDGWLDGKPIHAAEAIGCNGDND